MYSVLQSFLLSSTAQAMTTWIWICNLLIGEKELFSLFLNCNKKSSSSAQIQWSKETCRWRWPGTPARYLQRLLSLGRRGRNFWPVPKDPNITIFRFSSMAGCRPHASHLPRALPIMAALPSSLPHLISSLSHRPCSLHPFQPATAAPALGRPGQPRELAYRQR
jgi:hypothetical protein